MTTTGIHHVSVLSSSAKQAYHFYHELLGLKLVMKTVNQEDPHMYHLFFGDESGRPGTEFTVFEMGGAKNQWGANALERTVFLVAGPEALRYWEKRLEVEGVCHYGIEAYGSRELLRFEDEDGQPLGLTYHETAQPDQLTPYVPADIPADRAIRGIAEVHMRVRYAKPTIRTIRDYFDFEVVNHFEAWERPVSVLRHAANPFGHEVHVIEDKAAPIQRLGIGGIHHLAFGVSDRTDLVDLELALETYNISHSEIKNRDFMHSIYFREPNYSLFEVATPLTKKRGHLPDQDLSFDQVPLFLPDFLEGRRHELEAHFQYHH